MHDRGDTLVKRQASIEDRTQQLHVFSYWKIHAARTDSL